MSATVIALSFATSGCTAKKSANSANEQKNSANNTSELSPQQKFAKFMRREHGPFGKHPVTLLDGLSTGEVEAINPPKVECSRDGAARLCTLEMSMGLDEDGDPASVTCLVTTKMAPVGQAVHAKMADGKFLEPPQLKVARIGQGYMTMVTGNAGSKRPGGTVISTVKLAHMYARGYMAVCSDSAAGGRKTFSRVVNDFFSSLKFKENPAEPFLFDMGYHVRKGDKTTGLRYTYVSQTKDTGKFFEYGAAFHLIVTDRNWKTFDMGKIIIRDKGGKLTKYTLLGWQDGQGPFKLLAKPNEGDKFRIKASAGVNSDALELTPKVALSSELWSAPQLRLLSKGESESFEYGYPSLDSDSDPSLNYSVLTQMAPGVVGEKTATHAAMGSKDIDGDSSELHIDARGIVTKQVDAQQVVELLDTAGKLPELLTR